MPMAPVVCCFSSLDMVMNACCGSECKGNGSRYVFAHVDIDVGHGIAVGVEDEGQSSLGTHLEHRSSQLLAQRPVGFFLGLAQEPTGFLLESHVLLHEFLQLGLTLLQDG